MCQVPKEVCTTAHRVNCKKVPKEKCRTVKVSSFFIISSHLHPVCQELRCNPVKETIPQYQTVRSCSWPAKRHHDQFCTRRSDTDDDDDDYGDDDDDGEED